MTETQPVERTRFLPVQEVPQTTEDPRVQVLQGQMAELVTYVQSIGPPLAAVPYLQTQLTQVAEEMSNSVRSLESRAHAQEQMAAENAPEAQALPNLRFLTEVCSQAVQSQTVAHAQLTENLGYTQNVVRDLASQAQRASSPVADPHVQQQIRQIGQYICSRNVTNCWWMALVGLTKPLFGSRRKLTRPMLRLVFQLRTLKSHYSCRHLRNCARCKSRLKR